MTTAVTAPPAAGLPPLRRRRAVGVGLVLVAGLFVDFAAMTFSSLAVVGIDVAAPDGGAGLVALIAFQAGNLALMLGGAHHIARLVPPGRRPFVMLAAVSAFFLTLAGGFDLVIVVFMPDDADAAHQFVPIVQRIGVVVAWFLAASVWAGSCLLSEAHRRSGRPYRWPVVVAGAIMGAIHVVAWSFLGTSSLQSTFIG